MTPPNKPEWIELADADSAPQVKKVTRALPALVLAAALSIVGVGALVGIVDGFVVGEPIGGVVVGALVGVVDGFVVGEFDGVGVTVDLVAEVVVALLVGLAELPGLAGIVNLVPTTSAAGSSPMDFLLAS